MNLIPPQGARLLGAWPSAPVPRRRHGGPDRRDPDARADRSRSVRLARVLHPLRRPVALPTPEPSSTPPATARPA